LTYLDLFLTTGTSFTYKVEALDCGGNVIAASSEVGTLAAVAPVATRGARGTVKR